MRNPFDAIKIIDSLAAKIEWMGGYDFDRQNARKIRELCKDFILNDKTLEKYIEEVIGLKNKNEKITPSLVARNLDLDNYAASYVVDVMKEKKLL